MPHELVAPCLLAAVMIWWMRRERAADAHAPGRAPASPPLPPLAPGPPESTQPAISVARVACTVEPWMDTDGDVARMDAEEPGRADWHGRR